ncbi:MAG: hypothetical protein SOZ80_08455 [Prevotella sp.]|uniref:hypothetical protein n=1 Tax=Prevotella sp. TaxID=59823 RepID=UPI002A3112AF|nr:hypothetical protein [Prevotella sp.]MDD7319006.1 hypothetical protein [Prevotellaceae bacterium]MDY4020786.1 hypothetical protein [Prevotella sp.]
MKRVVVMLSLMAMAMFAQSAFAQNGSDIMSLKEINEKWKNQEIALPRNVTSPTVTDLVRAFNGVWQTLPGEMVVLNNDTPKKFDKVNRDTGYDYTVEKRRSGMFLQTYGSPETPWLEARMWIRSNGHYFFALNICGGEGSPSVMAFYDFDPNRSTLVPETRLLEHMLPISEGGCQSMKLPEEGGEVIINEHVKGWAPVLCSMFSWDGMNLVPEGNTLTEFGSMLSQYKEEEGGEIGDLTKFALIDIDGDGIMELWLRSGDEQAEGVLFAMGDGMPKLITSEDWKIKAAFARHGVIVSGSAGTGVFHAKYVLLRNSSITDAITYTSSYNITTEKLNVEYYRGANKISIKEGESVSKQVGDVREITPVWRKLCK